MRYIKPAVLNTTAANRTIQQTGQNKVGPSVDGIPSSAAGYEADE